MRLWSLHPSLLDAKGLVALWREGLLAQHVLAGKTKGYRHHPQLLRFQAHSEPMAMMGIYLHHIEREAALRGYNFNAAKIHQPEVCIHRIAVSDGQLGFELGHLRRKLVIRDPARLKAIRSLKLPDPHPLFKTIKGGIAEWERV